MARALAFAAALLSAGASAQFLDAGGLPSLPGGPAPAVPLGGQDAGFGVVPPPPPGPSALGDGGLVERNSEPGLLPPALLTDSLARYPEALVSQALAGEVKLQLLVQEDGRVGEVTVLEASHPLFAEAAQAAAVGLVFIPARVEGQAVPVRLFFSYRFEAPRLPPPAPSGTFAGLVRAKGTRRPIAGATLRSRSGLVVETDEEGRFRVELPAGPVALDVSAPGHKRHRFTETLEAGQALEVVYGLEPMKVNPYETIVRSDRQRTEVSRVTLHRQEIREVPGTMGDPFRVVMLLPGVGTMLSGVAYPVVRGSEPAATGTFIDGIRVPLLFHLFLGPAVVHPDFIETIDFYPGSVPPRYGRLVGGVIDGRISRPRDDRLHATAYADFLNAGLFAEAPIRATGTSVTLAGRVSYTPWITALAAEVFLPPPAPGSVNPTLVLDFFDYQGRIEQQLGKAKLRLFGFGSSDVFGTRYPDGQLPRFGGSAQQAIGFHRADARLTQPLGTGEAELGFTWGRDRLATQAQTRVDDASTSTRFDVEEDSLAARARLVLPIEQGVRLTLGGELDHREAAFRLRQEAEGLAATLNLPVAVATYFGSFAEIVWDKHPKWVVVPGVRLDSYRLVPGIDHLAVEPRLSVRRLVGSEVTFKAGAGIFHQPPTTLINLPVVDLAALRYGLQEGVQLSAGAEWRPKGGVELTAEAYFNPLLRTLELDLVDSAGTRAGAAGIEERGVLALDRGETHGYAWGVELLLRHPLGGNWFGWLSYSLSRSMRYATFERYDHHGEVVGTDTRYVPFTFDQTHIANAVVSYKLGAHWTVGTVLHFNTGRPESGLMGQPAQTQGTDTSGIPRWVPIDRDRTPRLPPFFRVDARIAYAHAYQSFNLEAYLDFLNATISNEVIAYSYFASGDGRQTVLSKQANGLPIAVPLLGIKARY